MSVMLKLNTICSVATKKDSSVMTSHTGIFLPWLIDAGEKPKKYARSRLDTSNEPIVVMSYDLLFLLLSLARRDDVDVTCGNESITAR